MPQHVQIRVKIIMQLTFSMHLLSTELCVKSFTFNINSSLGEIGAIIYLHLIGEGVET